VASYLATAGAILTDIPCNSVVQMSSL
jgi:hypothetical protein